MPKVFACNVCEAIHFLTAAVFTIKVMLIAITFLFVQLQSMQRTAHFALMVFTHNQAYVTKFLLIAPLTIL